MDQNLCNRWIGKNGPVACPLRSADLTSCDFFLRGLIKDRVFYDLPDTITELKTRIRDFIASIPEETLKML